jgi:polyisoprenoid-binding protein YceI
MLVKQARFVSTIIGIALLAAGCGSPLQASTPTEIPLPTPVVEQIVTPASPADTPAALPSPTAQPVQAEPISGSIRLVVVPEKSEARYRVTEQLVNVSLPNDAIGRTQAISGALVINPDGTIAASESRFEVDLSTLQSDESRRDNFLRQNILETGQYPLAVFVPTLVSGLPADLPQSGKASFQLIGDLTIRDVTRQVVWEVNGDLQGDELTGQATTSFTFDEFSISQPRVPVVLSVEDTIFLELDFTLQRAAE